MVGRSLLHIVWFVALLAGTQIIAVFLLAQSGDLPTAVLTDQLTSQFGTPRLWIAIGGLLVVASLLMRRQLRRLLQRQSDRQAQDILDALGAGADGADVPFVVYLRAFETTGKLKAPWFMFANDFGLQQLRSSEQESYIAWAVRRIGPLVALGEPGEHLGAGRIKTTDAEWKDVVRRLVAKATAIIIIPSDRPGTLWEIQHLRSAGLLHKTVFVMPAEARGFDWRARWHEARNALADFGASMPEYDRHGLMFALDQQGRLVDVHHLPVWRPGQFRKAVTRFIAAERAADEPAGRVTQAVRAARRHWRYGYLNGAVRTTATVGFVFAVATAEPVLQPSPVAEPWATFPDRWSAAVAVQSLGQQLQTRLMFNGAYQQLVADLGPARREALHGELLWRGLPWTTTQDLRAYFVGIGEAYGRLAPSDCRGLLQSDLGSATLNHALVRTPPAVVRDFADAMLAAIEAGVAHDRPPTVEQAQTAQAAQLFLAGLSAEDRARYAAIEAAPSATLPDADLCWLAVQTYRGFSRLDDEWLVPFFSAVDHDGLSISGLAASLEAAQPSEPPSALQQLLDSPDFQAQVAGLDEDARERRVLELMNAGLAHLDDDALLAYYRIFGRVIEALPTDLCADVATGARWFDETPAFEELPAAVHETYEALLFTAARLAAEQRPVPQPSDDAIEAAADSFVAQLTEEELVRLQQTDRDGGIGAGEDACWLLRKKVQGLGILGTPHREVWARAMITGRL